MMCSYCLSPLSFIRSVGFWVNQAGQISCPEAQGFMFEHWPIAADEVVDRCSRQLLTTVAELSKA